MFNQCCVSDQVFFLISFDYFGPDVADNLSSQPPEVKVPRRTTQSVPLLQ